VYDGAQTGVGLPARLNFISDRANSLSVFDACSQLPRFFFWSHCSPWAGARTATPANARFATPVLPALDIEFDLERRFDVDVDEDARGDSPDGFVPVHNEPGSITCRLYDGTPQPRCRLAR
jgi:hypothetical protein